MTPVLSALQLTGPELAIAALVVFAAAIVRGYSGFGFSMLAVTGLSLLRPPAQVVPMVLMLEIAASAHLLPSVWKDVDWRSLRWLFLGTLVATPIGAAGLANIPADTMRMLVSTVVLVAVAVLWRGVKLRQVPGPLSACVTGIVSGLLNGSAAIAGPPAILFYFSSPAGVVVSRASLITYFLGTDVVAAAMAAVYGLLTTAVALRAAVLLIPLVVGVTIGHRRFVLTSPESFRRFVLLLLSGLAVAGLIRAARG